MLRLLRENPWSFLFAILVHLILLGLLFFGLDWSSTIKPTASSKPAPVQAVVIDAKKLDAEVARKKKQTEDKKKAVEKKRAKEERKVLEAERARKQEQKRLADLKKKKALQAKQKKLAEQKIREAAAAQKKKAALEKKKKIEAEKERKLAQEKKRAEEERRKKAEIEKKRKAEVKRQRKEAEAELQDQLLAEQARLTAQRQSAMQRIISEYVLYIQEKVQRNWARPLDSHDGLSCTVEVRLLPSGDVIDANVVRGSGNPAFDRSVQAAVFKASPLPVPSDPEVMEQFRSLRFEFTPG